MTVLRSIASTIATISILPLWVGFRRSQMVRRGTGRGEHVTVRPAPFVERPSAGPFGFAGPWERWTPDGGMAFDTFTVITTAANDIIRPLHDRMPVILDPQDYSTWLARAADPERLASLISSPSDVPVAFFPVSTAVSNVRNDSPDLIFPVE